MGLAMASKWSAVPLAMLPGLALLALKLSGDDRVSRITLAEAMLWLGLMPLAVY